MVCPSSWRKIDLFTPSFNLITLLFLTVFKLFWQINLFSIIPHYEVKAKEMKGNLLMALMSASGPSSKKIMGGCFVPSHWIKVNWKKNHC